MASNGSATAAIASASSDVFDVIDVALEPAVASNNRTSSWVWSYLAPVTSKEQTGPRCNVFSQVINYGKSKSMSTLVSHFLHKHRSIYDENLSVDAAKKRKLFGTLDQFVVYGGEFMKS
jgi:hypothetical protein